MNLNNSNILVTGGCGFIGTNFILHLLKNYVSCRVLNFDLGPELHYAARGKNLDILSDEKRYVPFLGQDIRELDHVMHVFSDFLKSPGDNFAVVHFAADSHVTRSEDDPDSFFSTNSKGTETLINFLFNFLKAEDKALRFIHVSTDEVYGPAEKGVFFKENQDKNIVDRATSAYAKSKAKADFFAQSFLSNPFLNLNIVRPTNNFGPYQFPEKFLPRSITRLIRGQNAIVWGKGLQVRDWLFVDDTCRAICTILEKGEPGEIYNIGANQKPEITNADITKMVVEEMGLPKDRIQFIEDPRPQHDFRYAVDTEKLLKLGWRKGYFMEQLCLTIKWYQTNQSWWLPIVKEAESIYQKEKK